MQAKDALFPVTDIGMVREYLESYLAKAVEEKRVKNMALAQQRLEAAIEKLESMDASDACWNYSNGETTDQRIARLIRLASA